MTSSIWLPGIVVLAAGLAAGGIWAALKLRRGAREAPAADLRLQLRDLEARRDELYARLRGSAGEPLDPPERAALEVAAARTLREIDALSGRLPEEPATPATAATAAEPPPRRGFAARYPGVIGFAAGTLTVSLVAVLVFWAGRDATPRTDEGPTAVLPPDHPEVAEDLPAELEARIGALEARLEADPADLMARKELALAQLSVGRAFDAFQGAEEILQQVPEDPDGLFIQGVVRLSMGQTDEAVELLDRVLARFPDHLQALVYRGVALARGGETDRAVDSWELALELAGGENPEIERLIALGREELAGGSGSAPSAAVTPAAPPPAPAAEPADLEGRFAVVVELAPGAVADPRATLFVALRPAETGPPVAVRRVAAPRFPLRLVLGAEDSMMGQELPASGFISVRLDRDGSASTREPEDLEAVSAAESGGEVRLLLAPG